MGFLYILESEKDGRYYIGSTNNLERRLAEHNSGKTRSIKNLRPVRLVFYKEFDTLTQARQMELKLKSFKSRKILEKIVEDQNIKTGL